MCTGPYSNNCKSCKTGTFLDKNSFQCVIICPEKYYEDQINNECGKCNENCIKCNPENANECKSCIKTKFLLGT
jgi:hypothetical protein